MMSASARVFRGQLRTLLVFALVWLAVWPAHAQLCTPLETNDYVVMNGAPAPQVIVPLRPKPLVTELSAVVTRVVLNDKPRPTSRLGFKAVYDASNRQLALTIDPNSSSLLAPGVYKVTVELTGKVPPPKVVAAPRASAADAAGPAADAAPDAGTPEEPALTTQLFALQLILPPGRLAAVPPIKLSYDRLPGEDDVPPRSVKLSELSGMTNLSALSVRQPEPATNGDWQTDAHFDTPDAGTTLAAGTERDVRLEGHGFPLGVTKGQLVIQARELEQPLTVPFEVKARLHEFIIILVFFVSGLIGWFVRHYLKQAEARAVIEAQLAPLRHKATQEAAINTDLSRVQALKSADDAVAEALKGKDQAELTAKVGALKAALDAAVAARATAVNDELKLVGALSKLLTTRWDLPEAAASKLAATGALVAAAETALIAGDVREAMRIRGLARADIDKACEATGAWIEQAKPRLTSITPTPERSLPALIRSKVEAAAASAAEKLDACGVFDPAVQEAAAQVAAAEAYLRAAHSARSALRSVVSTLANGFEVAARETLAVLQAAGKTEQELKAMSDALDLDVSGEPLPALQALSGGITAFTSALRAFVGNTAEAKAKLESGDYLGALRANAVAAPQNISSSSRWADAALLRLVAPVSKELEAGERERYVVQMPQPSDPVAFAQARLESARLRGGLVSAAILAVVTWAVYRDAWVGTWGDILGVAVVAFFSDFTLDAVVGTLEKLRKPA